VSLHSGSAVETLLLIMAVFDSFMSSSLSSTRIVSCQQAQYSIAPEWPFLMAERHRSAGVWLSWLHTATVDVQTALPVGTGTYLKRAGVKAGGLATYVADN